LVNTAFSTYRKAALQILGQTVSLFGTIIIAFYPFATGLGFLMPIDLLFSTIIFYGLYRGKLLSER